MKEKEFKLKDFRKLIEKEGLIGMKFNEKEFNLSECIIECPACLTNIHIDAIKEFIKRDWKLFTLYVSGKITLDELIIRRNKLAGEKLVK